jgi:hypothetical protein
MHAQMTADKCSGFDSSHLAASSVTRSFDSVSASLRLRRGSHRTNRGTLGDLPTGCLAPLGVPFHRYRLPNRPFSRTKFNRKEKIKLKKQITPENPPLLPNRLAPDAKLWSADDRSYIVSQSPLDIKRRELSETRQLEDPDERTQSESIANARNSGKVKPI